MTPVVSTARSPKWLQVEPGGDLARRRLRLVNTELAMELGEVRDSGISLL